MKTLQRSLKLGACLLSTSIIDAQEAKKPNILVFFVDDLGYMDVSINNPNSFYETPHIDALAHSGMLFTDGYASCPVCSPSRVSMLTGKYPTRVGTTHLFPGKKGNPGKSGKFKPAPFVSELPLEEITIAEALKTKGYTTFFAGKWHLGYGEAFRPQKQGFDINIGGHDKGGPYTGKKYFAPFKNPEIKKESPAGEHLPHRLAKETVKFINESGDKPFLAYLSFYSVHTPLQGRKDLINKYKQKAKKQNNQPSEQDFAKIQSAQPRINKMRVKQTHTTYAAMVEAMDLAVGHVIDGLKKSGKYDSTIIVFTSDNGGLSTSEGHPTSNLPLNGGKGWIYEGGIREPWIIRYPGVTKAGSVSKTPISGIDLFPTVAKVVGYNVDDEIDGVDLRPALEGKELGREALYWHYPHYSNQGGFPGGVIRMGNFKLIENYDDGTVSLYNLTNDLGELNNLVDKHPEKTSEMRKMLHTFYQKHNAKFLQPLKGNRPWKPNYLNE